MLVPGALMQSMASFVAQNVGAGKEDRAKKAMATGMLIGCKSIVSQLPKKPLWYSLHFPAHFHIIENIDHDSKYRCAGRRQTDHREARIRLDTHEPGHGQTHDKRVCSSDAASAFLSPFYPLSAEICLQQHFQAMRQSLRAQRST